MILSLLEPLTSRATSDMLTGAFTLLKMTCVLLTALAVTVTMRRSSAGTRHLVWLVALTSLLLLPILAAWAPLRIRMLPEPVVLPTAVVALPAPSGALVSVEKHNIAAEPRPPSQPSAHAPAPRRSIAVGSLLIALWLVGVLALLARLALGAWAIRRIVRGARLLEQAEWNQPLYEIADRLGLREAPRLLQSDRVKIPFACGFLRACIVLPADSEGWSAERRSAVLVHELAHVRRRDLIGHTVSWIVCALYWFHPLVWTAARRLRVESERACDDLALVLGARPSEYAEHLLDIVAQVRGPGAPAVALAMANPNEFEGRMLAILNPQVRRRGLSRVQAAWLVASLTVAALVVGAVSPAPRAAVKRPAPEPSLAHTPAILGRDDADVGSGGAGEPETRAGAIASAEETADRGDRPAEEWAAEEVAPDETHSEKVDGGDRVAVLAKTLRNDASPEVRRVAAWGLARHAHADVAAEELARALVSDEDEEVREMSAWALSESRRSSSAVTALYAAFRRDKSAHVRRTAAWAAGSIGDRSAVPGLVGLLADRDPSLREVAAWSIGSCGVERAPAALVRLLSDPNREVRISVAWALREIEDGEAADALESAFRHEEDPEVRLGLIRALGSMGEQAVETLSRLVESPDPQVRAVAITALAGGNATGPWPWPRPDPRPFP